MASESGELVLSALDAGAVDFVQKPTALATDRLLEISDELVDKVKAVAGSRIRKVASVCVPATVASGARAGSAIHLPRATDVAIVVVGISTGGPQALKVLIPRLPADLAVPIAVVLHMPVGYTELYAHKLNEQSALTVVEAEDAQLISPGVVYIAPAGRHLSFQRNAAGEVVTHLDVRPLDTPYRPSVDVLFQSAADIYGSRVLGVVMTGMGYDGKEGSRSIKAKGGAVMTESEDSCVVYGMSRAVVEAGLSDDEVPLELMADAVLGRL